MEKRNRCRVRLAVFFAALAAPLALEAELPGGWQLAGSAPGEFVSGIVETKTHGAAGYLRAATEEPTGFGTLMQTISAAGYRGKRMRFSGLVSTRGVGKGAGLWMRIDGTAGQALAFDNMQERRISGSTDWTRYDIVLDVPQEGFAIAFGVLLTGNGEVRIDELQFEAVGANVAATGRMLPRLPSSPANLSFDD